MEDELQEDEALNKEDAGAEALEGLCVVIIINKI